MTDHHSEENRSEEEHEDEGPMVHTSAEEGHPAGTGERSDRDIGGPTTDPDSPPDEEDVTGGGPGTKPEGGFEPHE